MPRPVTLTIGLISDTHGLLRPEALALLHGSDHIIHAGDIGSAEILDALRALAPVTAVRGNNDTGAWASAVPQTSTLNAGAARIYVLHDIAEMDLEPARAGFQAVIAGHSHRPAAVMRDGVLFVNPGSAGPRRFSLPISVGRLHVTGNAVRAELLQVECPPAVKKRRDDKSTGKYLATRKNHGTKNHSRKKGPGSGQADP
jgi:putative phosphoesterase